jgi:hypothetical protein
LWRKEYHDLETPRAISTSSCGRKERTLGKSSGGSPGRGEMATEGELLCADRTCGEKGGVSRGEMKAAVEGELESVIGGDGGSASLETSMGLEPLKLAVGHGRKSNDAL